MDTHDPLADDPLADDPLADGPSFADKLTAYHEAGHAVVALLVGRLVQRVSILPKLTRLGQCQLKKGTSKPPKDWLESEGLILLAGAAAEGRISGRYCWAGAADDLRQVRALICSRAASVKQAERLEKRWLDKVESVLDGADIWLAVELIAADLLARKTISGRAARHHYDQAAARVAKQRKG